MNDAFEFSQMDKSKPLRIGETRKAQKCVLCDGPIAGDDATEWVVTIKGKKAHPHCAVDHGWTVQ